MRMRSMEEASRCARSAGAVVVVARRARIVPRRLAVRTFPGLQLAQVVVEAVEALLPAAAVLSDPVRDLAQGRRFEAARPPLRIAPAADQPRALEHLQVARYCGQAHG